MVLHANFNIKLITGVIILFLTFDLILSDKREIINNAKTAEDLFRRLYKLERTEQTAAIKALLNNNHLQNKQSQMVEAIADRVFNVIKKSKLILEEVGFIPGESSFPIDEKIRDALSNVLENTAFLGDIVLRLPDLSQRIILNNSGWNELFKWSLVFTNGSLLVDTKTSLILGLVNQEMNYTLRKPNYMNPFQKLKNHTNEQVKEKVTKVKKKKSIRKGPRLSARQFEEL